MEPRHQRVLRWCSVSGVAAALAAGAWWTGERGADELVDFGRELYIAWRISLGEHLYADLRYEYGPVSPYLNGLVFKLFGPGVQVLVAFNVALLALMTAAWYRLLDRLGGPLAAFVGCLAFLALFAFGHFDPPVVFHYLAPYTHGTVHGLLLGIAATLLVHRHLERGSWRTALCLGACAGTAFLMKPEISLAVLAVAATGLIGAAWLRRTSPLHEALPASLGFALPPLAVAVALAVALPPGHVIEGVFGAWRPLLDPTHMGSHFASFSSHVLGLDDVGMSLLISAVACLVWSLLLLPALLIARKLPDTPVSRWAGGGLAFVAVAATGLFTTSDLEPHEWVAWGAPPLTICLASLPLLLRGIARHGRDSDAVRRITALALALLALGLLSRTGIRPRFIDYGFVAGMPAFGLALLAGISWIPRRLEARGRAGNIFRGAVIGFTLFLAIGHLGITADKLETRQHPLGSGRDRLLAGERGPVLADALTLIERFVPADGDLLVVPEGIMLNHLSRRRSTTSHLSFIPPLVAWFGEDQILRELKAGPPGHILVIDRETGEFGPLRFGTDYARDVADWIDAHYEPVGLAGARPLTGQGFGAELLAPRAE